MKKLALALGLGVPAWFLAVAALILWEEPLPSSGKADVAIVLGAALGRDGAPSPVFQGRLEQALSLYRAGRVRRLLFTGGQGEGMRVSEAAAARGWIMRRGVPAQAIVIEERSRTTLQNLREAKPIMRKAGLRTALVVSDPLHLPRALRMAKREGMAAAASPTPTSRYRTAATRLPFLAREAFFLTGYWLVGA